MVTLCGLREVSLKSIILLISIILLFVIIIINKDNRTSNPLNLFVLENADTTQTSQQSFVAAKQSLQFLSSSNTRMCPSTTMAMSVIMGMEEFNSRCSVHRTTFLPMVDQASEDALPNVIHLMAEDPQVSPCTCPRTLKVADFPIPMSGLVSFPGSGNTWTRHLIQQLTGIHSGSVYPHAQSKPEFPYEGITTSMSVVKSHRPPNPNGILNRELIHEAQNITLAFDQLMILVRNPFAALMAEFKRLRMRLGKKNNGFIDSCDPKWKGFVSSGSKRWGFFIKEAFTTSLPTHVVFYEDLQSCLLPELIKMALFFRSRHLDDFSFCCTLREHEGTFHRSPSNQTIEDVYSPEYRKEVNDVVFKIASRMKDSRPDVAKRILGYLWT